MTPIKPQSKLSNHTSGLNTNKKSYDMWNRVIGDDLE